MLGFPICYSKTRHEHIICRTNRTLRFPAKTESHLSSLFLSLSSGEKREKEKNNVVLTPELAVLFFLYASIRYLKEYIYIYISIYIFHIYIKKERGAKVRWHKLYSFSLSFFTFCTCSLSLLFNTHCHCSI